MKDGETIPEVEIAVAGGFHFVLENIDLGSDNEAANDPVPETTAVVVTAQTIQRFVRSSTFTKSLRYARVRVNKISKRLASSADDLSKMKDGETIPEVEIADLKKTMVQETKFSNPKRYEFDYNAALEVEFEKFRRLYGSPEEEALPGDIHVTLPSNEIVESDKHKRHLSVSEYISTKRKTSVHEEVNMKWKQKRERRLSGSVALAPLKSEQYVRRTRRTLMIDGHVEKCECTITDNDDGEIQFSCILSQEGIVCRNYRTMLDIVSIGCLQHLDEDNPIGIYYTIEGYKDGQIARIRKGKTFSRIKYQLNLVTPEDRKMVLSLPNNTHSRTSPLPILKQSLVIHREWGNILKIRTKSGNIPIATIQKEMSSMRYWLHLEPNVDSCFVSAIAAYVLRKKLFGDRLPKVLKTQSNFSRRARRLSLSFRRRKKPRPNVTNSNSAPSSSTL